MSTVEKENTITEEDLDYDSDLEVDPHNLHEEWLKQVHLENKYGKLLVVANKNLSNAAEHVKITRSGLIKECKENRKGGKTPTDKDAESYYRLHPKHKRAKREQIQAEYEYGMMQNAVWRIQTRKLEIQELWKMYCAEYFTSDIASPRDFDKELIENMRKRQARDKIKRAHRLTKSRRTK